MVLRLQTKLCERPLINHVKRYGKSGVLHSQGGFPLRRNFTLRSRKKFTCVNEIEAIGTLSKDVFEQRTSTGSEAFSLFICVDAHKFVLLSFFSLIKTIYLRVSTKPLPNDAKSPLPVDIRHSKTLLLTSSAPGKIGLPRPKPERYSQKIALLPIAPKFGTKEINRFSQSPA